MGNVRNCHPHLGKGEKRLRGLHIRKSLRLVSEGSITVLLFYSYSEIDTECGCEEGEKRSDVGVRGKKNPSQRKACVSKVGRRVREPQLQPW